MRLTDMTIRTLPSPQKGQKIYFDDTLPNFGCRVSQGGTRSFVVQHGITRQLVTIARYPTVSLADARAQARKVLAERVLGKYQPETVSYADALSLFLKAVEQKNKPRTHSDYTRTLNRHFKFGATPLTDITPADINRRLDRLVKTPSEQLHALNTIKIFFNWALRKRYLDRSPCQGMRGSKGKARSRVLTDAELKAVWDAAVEYPFGAIVRLLILTGLRRGEVSQLKWSYIKDDTFSLPPDIVKNNRTHIGPLGRGALDILQNLPRFESEYVFPALRGDGVFRGWHKCKLRLDKNAAVYGWTLHDLRRTFRTNHAKIGTPPHIAERLINHISAVASDVQQIYEVWNYMPDMRKATLAYEAELLRIFALDTAQARAA
jgi:integrase